MENTQNHPSFVKVTVREGQTTSEQLINTRHISRCTGNNTGNSGTIWVNEPDQVVELQVDNYSELVNQLEPFTIGSQSLEGVGRRS